MLGKAVEIHKNPCLKAHVWKEEVVLEIKASGRCRGGSLNFHFSWNPGFSFSSFHQPMSPMAQLIIISTNAPAWSSWSTAHSAEFPGAESSPWTPTHSRFALKSCAWSSPHLVRVTNTHRELCAGSCQALPHSSYFTTPGNVQRNRSELLGPFTPRGFDSERDLHHKSSSRGEVLIIVLIPWRSTTGSTDRLGKAVEFWAVEVQSRWVSSPFHPMQLFQQGKQPNRALLHCRRVLWQRKISGIKPTPKPFLSENPFIYNTVLFFFSLYE